VIPLSSFIVLKYEHKEFYLEDDHLLKSHNGFEVDICPLADSELGIKKENSHLEMFDYSVLGNTGKGNHFVFWFDSYGYEYYYLKIDNDSTAFKFNTKGNAGKGIVQLEFPFEKKFLLASEYSRNIYLVRMNE